MKKTAIIGGGIGGLALANSFEKFKINYQLFENAAQFGEVGAGIGISESTLEILSWLGLQESLLDKGRFVKEAVIVDKNRKLIRKLPLPNGGFCIHRPLLIQTLSSGINQKQVCLNHQLTDIQVKENSSILTFQNGSELEFETVIACDGINSIIRNKLFPDLKKRYSGQTIWRGIANCQLPAPYHNTYFEFWGNNLRFATIPLNQQEYYWYAVKPAKAGEQEVPERVPQELEKLFRNFVPEVARVINSTPHIMRNDMWDLPPGRRTWHYKNVVFIGDAIHATTPNLAQGGCQAIEDAFTLSQLIYKYGIARQTFEKYKELRQEKVNYIVNQSWNYGKIAHQSNMFTEFGIKLLFKRVLPKHYFINQYKKLIDIEYLTVKS